MQIDSEEKNFILNLNQKGSLISCLEREGFSLINKHKPAVWQSVFFIDDEQSNTFDLGIEAYRNSENLSDEIHLNDLENQLFELIIQEVKKPYATLARIVEDRQTYLPGLRPYLLVEYRRCLYSRKDKEAGYVAIDSDMKFWFFPKDVKEAVALGKIFHEKLLRIKVLHGSETISHLLALGALPTIAREYEGLYAIKKWLDNKFAKPLTKELAHCEIEAKYTLTTENPDRLFSLLKEYCREKTFPIALDPDYPFTMTTASLNHYWKRWEDNHPVEGVKLFCRGPQAKVVLKSEKKNIDTELSIVERKEIKGDKFNLLNISLAAITHSYEKDLGVLKYVGYLKRIRKAIWLLNSVTGRYYHITLDLCTSPNKASPLYQIEIEYSGRRKERAKLLNPSTVKTEIISEIRLIAEKLIAFANDNAIELALGEEKFTWLCS